VLYIETITNTRSFQQTEYERRVLETLIVVDVSDIYKKFITNKTVLQRTDLHMQNLCTIPIRPFMHTVVIMGFCTLLLTAVVPADVSGW
jgi:hypothetical protein